MGSIRQAPFEIALNGIGHSSGAAGRTGLGGRDASRATPCLHKKIDATLARVGVEPDQRAFLPHITLARLNRGAGPVGDLLEQSGGLTSTPFTVDRFALFESDLTPDGSVYSIVERYPLA